MSLYIHVYSGNIATGITVKTWQTDYILLRLPTKLSKSIPGLSSLMSLMLGVGSDCIKLFDK